MRSATLSFWIVVAVATFAQAAEAQPRGRRGPMGEPPSSPGEDETDIPPPHVLARVARELGLSEDQTARARRIVDEARREAMPLREELIAARRALRDHLGGDRVDARQAGELVDRVGGLRTRLQKIRVLALVRIRSVLTPDQWSRLLELRAANRGRGRPRF